MSAAFLNGINSSYCKGDMKMTEQERMKAGFMWLDDAENMEMQARAR